MLHFRKVSKQSMHIDLSCPLFLFNKSRFHIFYICKSCNCWVKLKFLPEKPSSSHACIYHILKKIKKIASESLHTLSNNGALWIWICRQPSSFFFFKLIGSIIVLLLGSFPGEGHHWNQALLYQTFELAFYQFKGVFSLICRVRLKVRFKSNRVQI